MSKNIYFKNKDSICSPIQTPTYITNMLLTHADGTIKNKVGKEALLALYQYKAYIIGLTDGVYLSEEVKDKHLNQVALTLMEIDQFLHNTKVKDLVAYTL